MCVCVCVGPLLTPLCNKSWLQPHDLWPPYALGEILPVKPTRVYTLQYLCTSIRVGDAYVRTMCASISYELSSVINSCLSFMNPISFFCFLSCSLKCISYFVVAVFLLNFSSTAYTAIH